MGCFPSRQTAAALPPRATAVLSSSNPICSITSMPLGHRSRRISSPLVLGFFSPFAPIQRFRHLVLSYAGVSGALRPNTPRATDSFAAALARHRFTTSLVPPTRGLGSVPSYGVRCMLAKDLLVVFRSSWRLARHGSTVSSSRLVLQVDPLPLPPRHVALSWKTCPRFAFKSSFPRELLPLGLLRNLGIYAWDLTVIVRKRCI
ncbi:hypothetical protein DFH07DRAFT_964719 [Mycena maculata]|uniref:Uncharacterized protein n=1 Tax=Mycena maculata TaxID=230809 RepID=A0AAD7N1X2_9AGAR|nr:hypothetical protein DFH07DRAFT_964719 [Mycena maculata]